MKVIAIVAATMGTCGGVAVGDTGRIPPSEAERAAVEQPSQQQEQPAAEQNDPWAGLPDECRELNQECADCDEVERMRRKIEFNKCMPVCEAYLEHTDMVATLPVEAIARLQTSDGCGKQKTSCTPIEQKRCELAIDYSSLGEEFRTAWSQRETTPIDGLSQQFYSGMLVAYLDHHQRVIKWAQGKNVDATGVLSLGGELFRIRTSDMVRDITTELAAAEDRSLPAVTALVDLARFPGEPGTFADRRTTAESPMKGE